MVKFTYIKTLGVLFFFLISFFVVNAQESVEQYTQYLYNPMSINPSVAGVTGATSIFGSYRTQWVGINGAPQTIILSADTPVKNKKMGLGLSLLNDRIGPADQSAIAVDFAYNIRINTNYKLAFGVKATANLINVDFTKLAYKDKGDFAFDENIDNRFSPNVGFGFNFYSDRTTIGLSIPNLLETKFYDKYTDTPGSSRIAKDNLSVFLTGDHLFELSDDLTMKPAILFKITQNGGPAIQTYISSTFAFYEKFTLGVSYRFRGTISALAGFQVTDGLFIGYGYDLETRMLRTYSTASHEIFVRFNLFPKNNKKAAGKTTTTTKDNKDNNDNNNDKDTISTEEEENQ